MNMIKQILGSCIAGTLLSTAQALTVETSTVVCNPGSVVTVPVTITDTEGVSWLSAEIASDSTVAALLGVERGPCAPRARFLSRVGDDGSCTLRMLGFEPGTTGVVAKLRFAVREGTQALYSDVTITDVACGNRTGVADVTVANPVRTVNGMIRVMATSAEVKRLEERFVVWPESTLQRCTFGTGDAIMASSSRTEPIQVSGAVSASCEIEVLPPVDGWSSGSYRLLSTPTSGLRLRPTGLADVSVVEETTGSISTYSLSVTLNEELEVVAKDGDLADATEGRIRAMLEGELVAQGVKRLEAVAPDGKLDAIVDLGIRPSLSISGTLATATYSLPGLRIIAFDQKTGLVRIRVTPAEGNTIAQSIANGCLSVYGTSDLKLKMERISEVEVDLSDYLTPSSIGEADLTVMMGAHAFLKVFAGKEN